ncbi:FAD-binding protein [Streptomyces sp. L7]
MAPEYADFTTGEPVTDTKSPTGPINERWDTRRFEAKLVNPANRRKHTVIVVGTGLAGGPAGATLAEQGYHVVQFCYQDSPRRAHSIAAQGGINAAKNYRNDGDQSTASSTTPSRAATSGPASPTSTGSRRSP